MDKEVKNKTFHEQVHKMAARFRILRDWGIVPVESYEYAGMSLTDLPTRSSAVYAWNLKGKKELFDEPEDYVFHEVLHVCLRVLRARDGRSPKELRKAEEELVQDICAIYTEALTKPPKPDIIQAQGGQRAPEEEAQSQG